MISGLLSCLWILTSCGASRPPRRGSFAAAQLDSHNSSLVEGDIALPPNPHGSGSALNAFLKDRKALWPRGRVPYRIDTDEWDEGIVEPVFLDSQIENITQALQKIESGVPCIDFKWASFSILSINCMHPLQQRGGGKLSWTPPDFHQYGGWRKPSVPVLFLCWPEGRRRRTGYQLGIPWVPHGWSDYP